MRRLKAYALNRIFILLALAAIVAGLLLGQWRIVLHNAILLCYSCIGLG